MPLVKSKSKEARNTNIKREIAAGKPPKQAVAIGYAVQRRAKAAGSKKKARGSLTADEENNARERRYRAEDGIRTLMQAEEVRGDRDRMKDMADHAAAQHALMQNFKRGAVSKRQYDRARK